MIRMYCRGHHGTKTALCADCGSLQSYARRRLQACPFHDDKTTCSKCPVHCYKAEMRDKIQTVMRYAGPRMMKHHPILAIFHLIDGLKH